MQERDRLWPRPVVVPEARWIIGVSEREIDLSGVWEINTEPEEDFFVPGSKNAGWQDIPVPGETSVYGVYPKNMTKYAYRTEFSVPEDYRGMTVKIRFEGAVCAADVYVDGRFVRSHYGGFNGWDADITGIGPGRHTLVVGMENRSGEMSGFSSGGLIRPVKLFALPALHIERLHVKTEFSAGYADARLTVLTKLSRPGDARVHLTVAAPNGDVRDLGEIDGSNGEDGAFSFDFPAVQKWDSEHPNLYTLRAELLDGGRVTEKVERRFGFREIEIRGSRMFVNGDEVKLRGSDRHDSHPLTGHSLTREQIDADFARFKEANVNLIRTSHYNPCQYFLNKCDEEGMYVELETSVSFIGQGQDMVSDDPAYAGKFMEQFAESIERNLSRPAVIIWSLSNECVWGNNFKLEQDYVHQEDPTRPTVFSYPITIRDEEDIPDVWSVHYALEDMDPSLLTDCMYRGISFATRPVLHDEFIHVPCYIFQTRECDIGVRDEWGETVKRFWDKIYDTEGALGGAIWCGLDDYVYTPRGCRGSNWGVMDAFRRCKPETWLVKKGYTPVYIENKPIGSAVNGEFAISVRNRFNHTRLSEIRVEWDAGEKRGSVMGPDIAPRECGTIRIPAEGIGAGDTIHIRFFEQNGNMTDEYCLRQAELVRDCPRLSGKAPDVEYGSEVVAKGDRFSIAFSRETGKITCGALDGKIVIAGGPEMNLNGRGVAVHPWRAEKVEFVESDALHVLSTGYYGKIRVSFDVSVDDGGLIQTRCTVDDIPFNSPRAIAMINGDDIGGYLETGVYFVLPADTEKLAWEKDGLHNCYPAWHIGRLFGEAEKVYPPAAAILYPEVPAWDWQLDMKDFSLLGKDDLGGRGTRDFISGKSRIYRAAAGTDNAALAAYSNGRHMVRMELEKNPASVIDSSDPRVTYTGTWLDREDLHGLSGGREKLSRTQGDTVSVRFTGSGIAWRGTKYMTHGQADVYLDGELAAKGVELFSGRASNSSKGRERVYGAALFQANNLPFGDHELKIVVTGARHTVDAYRPALHDLPASNCYVSVDYFEIPDGNTDGRVRMYVNNEWNSSDLHWGCYMKPPILVDSGYCMESFVRMEGLKGDGENV